MPKGPKGEKRPADVIGAAILVGHIATGDDEDKPGKTPNRAKGGKAGDRVRGPPQTLALSSLPLSMVGLDQTTQTFNIGAA